MDVPQSTMEGRMTSDPRSHGTKPSITLSAKENCHSETRRTSNEPLTRHEPPARRPPSRATRYGGRKRLHRPRWPRAQPKSTEAGLTNFVQGPVEDDARRVLHPRDYRYRCEASQRRFVSPGNGAHNYSPKQRARAVCLHD